MRQIARRHEHVHRVAGPAPGLRVAADLLRAGPVGEELKKEGLA
jgi:hypothetical protein